MVTAEEKVFLELVKNYRHIGFGRMQQIISNAWYRAAERDYPGTGTGAHVTNTCLEFLSDQEKRAFMTILEQDEDQGMEY